MPVATQPAARGVALVPPFTPGSTPQSPLKGAPNPNLNQTNLNQTMPHANVLTAHTLYTQSPQPHFGVAAPVYPPGANPG